jgi:hypothetical protein
MPIRDFSPSDMQLLKSVIDRVSAFLNLKDGAEHHSLQSRITAIVVKCAEHGERNFKKLFDCALAGLRKANGG